MKFIQALEKARQYKSKVGIKGNPGTFYIEGYKLVDIHGHEVKEFSGLNGNWEIVFENMTFIEALKVLNCNRELSMWVSDSERESYNLNDSLGCIPTQHLESNRWVVS